MNQIFRCRGVRSPRLSAVLFTVVTCLFTLSLHSSAVGQSDAPVEECNQFSAVVNQNQEILSDFEQGIGVFSRSASQAETLQDVTAAASEYVDILDNVTEDLNGLTSNLTAVPLTDNQLLSHRDDYVTVVAGIGEVLITLSSSMSTVAESTSEAELVDSLETVSSDTLGMVEVIEELSAKESDIVSELNTYCGAE
jgi:hypothetical protein